MIIYLETESRNEPAFKLQNFIPSEVEDDLYRETLKVLLARDIVQFMPELQWMKGCIPTNIPHTYSSEMKKKSSIHLLPVSLNNETSYGDCINILEEYTDMIRRWYTKAGRGMIIYVILIRQL